MLCFIRVPCCVVFCPGKDSPAVSDVLTLQTVPQRARVLCTRVACYSPVLCGPAYCSHAAHLLACHCMKRREVNSNTRENDAIQRHREREKYEAPAGICGILFHNKVVLG